MVLRRVIVAACCWAGATVSQAEWEIVSVSTKPFTRESYNGPPEVWMDLSIKNVSENDILVWGQTFAPDRHFYLIESYIQKKDSAVWERQNIGMCGSVGKTGWIRVKPGQVIEQGRVEFQHDVGKNMILVFPSSSAGGDPKQTEILVGPFKVPEPSKSEPSDAADSR